MVNEKNQLLLQLSSSKGCHYVWILCIHVSMTMTWSVEMLPNVLMQNWLSQESIQVNSVVEEGMSVPVKSSSCKRCPGFKDISKCE